MNEENLNTNATANFHDQIPLMSPEVTLLILTWVVFVSVLLILHKFAWKPILAALDAREETIRGAIDNADLARKELAQVEEKRIQILAQANTQAKELIENSRKGAHEAARIIQQKAKEETQILLENAYREINEVKEKVQADLREESAQIAVQLAGKLIEANLDDERNRKLINQFIKEI